ncbi:SRPBCC domain-containing protein [Arachidicoccus ginsenosidivorans]|uniref:SRPBCC domain-containing protein n=1 Tax=Arachidicoccus ginsenosidivorans TaxID=496057 RepID=A0A5B8VTX6_9BACT|nr:SRPBCC domain-containing protein [Arachidicoccus ginsenosidivorans]QEC73598.1 SRPBCC domain-containing protein [Arachidicoccus ginsenosidivorans]
MEKSIKTQEVFIEEVFNASIQSVFDAWTDPEQLMKWYAPDGCTISFKTLDIKKGGKYHCCISNPTYGDCWAIGEYLEILPYAKVVFSMDNADENGNPINPADIGMDKNWPGKTVVTVTFQEENCKTRLTLRQTVSQALAQKTGAYPSWLQMLSNMRSLLESK